MRPQENPKSKDKAPTLVYAGTYTAGTHTKDRSKGIYVYRLQPTGSEVFQNVTLVPLGVAAETQNPSFITLDLKRRLLFCVNELDAGTVSAFSINADGRLTLLNQQSTKGAGPCHLALDKEGKNLIVANYASGSVAVVPVGTDGKLAAASDFVQHSGKSADAKAQTQPHPHCAAFDPSGKSVFVCDLGLDKIMAYRFDSEHGKLAPADPAFTAVKPGSGPRHMVFRPDGLFAYVINELTSTVSGFAYDTNSGSLKQIEEVSSLPGYYDGPNTGAEIAVHPQGKFLYASNRGNETVVLFTIDKDTGKLNWVEEQGTGGKTPRNFGIEPSGEHMAIANQDSNTLLAARVDAANGRLKPSGIFADCPSPACAVFLPPAPAA